MIAPSWPLESSSRSAPPFGVWLTAFLGAGLLYWRLRGLRLRARLLAGWLAGLACFAIGLFWAVVVHLDPRPRGAVLVEAVPLALAGALTPPERGRLFAFVGAATLAEALRMSWPFGGLPVGGVFLGQAGGPLLGAARLGGPLLLTALVWLAAWCWPSWRPPASSAAEWGRARPVGRPRCRGRRRARRRPSVRSRPMAALRWAGSRWRPSRAAANVASPRPRPGRPVTSWPSWPRSLGPPRGGPSPDAGAVARRRRRAHPPRAGFAAGGPALPASPGRSMPP